MEKIFSLRFCKKEENEYFFSSNSIFNFSQYARTIPKSNEKTEFVQNLENFAKKNSFSLEETTTKINARKKKVVCTLFNSLGMVVPVENDIGYRPVPMSKGFRSKSNRFSVV